MDDRDETASVEQELAKLHAIVKHAQDSIAAWTPGKYREATVTFYSRSSRPDRAHQGERTKTAV